MLYNLCRQHPSVLQIKRCRGSRRTSRNVV
ncbi:hypothetical protein Ccrd_015474 [Cynara cardunculus var. scolymus]|uniref:Uncharacterized protein n=1 Tax=Cynara cardunculus var. scolymus TaxID=59895 RepID=A0A103YBR6_CYNCS|nr:hypothetical protein Ccrd_015474 [Cynara cardunculus var. scolymus]